MTAAGVHAEFLQLLHWPGVFLASPAKSWPHSRQATGPAPWITQPGPIFGGGSQSQAGSMGSPCTGSEVRKTLSRPDVSR